MPRLGQRAFRQCGAEDQFGTRPRLTALLPALVAMGTAADMPGPSHTLTGMFERNSAALSLVWVNSWQDEILEARVVEHDLVAGRKTQWWRLASRKVSR